MSSQKIISFSWVFSAFISISLAQVNGNNDEFNPEPRGEDGLRVMFYNVENLFDTFDDPAINDDEFSQNGEKRWTYFRYKEKLNDIAKIIIAVGGWEPPDLVGLCEIENFQVLLDLTSTTPLKKFGYQIIHENSMDSRGIDNAILYLPQKLKKIEHQSIAVDLDKKQTTRDILYASFNFRDVDTIHFFVNHWPSRYGGKQFTDDKRLLAAETLRLSINEMQSINSKAKIMIMGDFNDEPNDLSLVQGLEAMAISDNVVEDQLYNLSQVDFQRGLGTLTYKEIEHTWFLFDQIIASGALINGNGLQTLGMKNHIFSAGWLLENGRPNRTFQGPIYHGGFSDHLPIFIDLYYKE